MENLNGNWKKHLENVLSSEKFVELQKFIEDERKNKSIFPAPENIFSALNQTPLDKIKVVILGQDPYHGAGQAHGLAFSVLPGVKTPPSLVNIYKELESDLGISRPEHGHLNSWAEQGVLMLNNVLTVEEKKAGSHQKKGWEEFTNEVIEVINREREGVVFLLWGAPAQKKAKKVDRKRHIVFEAPHPSPLSAYRGFFGCQHFSKTNEYLSSKGLKPIDWNPQL